MPIATHMYAIRDGEQFENLDSYVPDEGLLRYVAPLRTGGWTILPGGYWSMCWPPSITPIPQGWKIHIAGTLDTAADLLARLLPVFETECVPFKFCSDMKMVRLSISKNWERTSAGKFITVYPQDDESFERLADRCHKMTRDLAGPFILTDRPYQDSKVVFYRYGSHLPRYRAEASGLRTPIIVGPDGSAVPDRRVPYFITPPWVSDPFSVRTFKSAAAAPAQMRLKDGRYAIEGVFRFSSVGGIYYGTDTESRQSVVIREQRPLVGTSGAALEKEARILQKLGPLEIAPKFIDLFEEQSHRFLVQERILADNLWDRTMGIYWGDVTPRTPAELLTRFQDTIRKLVYAVECAHSKRIVLLSRAEQN